MPPTIGTNVLGRKVLYLPSFFTYGECAFQAGGPAPTKKVRHTSQGEQAQLAPGNTQDSAAPRLRTGREEGIKE